MDMSPLLSAVLSFVFVLGLLLATLWFVRTRGIGVGTMQGKNLRVVNSLRLGPKHRLDVVEYEGKRLLLGVAANPITLLDNQQLESASETAPADDAADPAAATQSAPGSFAGQRRRLMQPNNPP